MRVGSPARGKTNDVVALHAQVVGEIEDVVGRADDEGVEVLLDHRGSEAIQLRIVAGPGHPVAEEEIETCTYSF